VLGIVQVGPSYCTSKPFPEITALFSSGSGNCASLSQSSEDIRGEADPDYPALMRLNANLKH
jgi:hypothetical protein